MRDEIHSPHSKVKLKPIWGFNSLSHINNVGIFKGFSLFRGEFSQCPTNPPHCSSEVKSFFLYSLAKQDPSMSSNILISTVLLLSKCGTYRGYSACERADDLRHAASRSVQHALGAGLKQQHAGQVEDQSWILRLLQLLSESLTVQEQGLSAWHAFTQPKSHSHGS